MNRAEAEAFLRSNHRAVLETIKKDGRPHSSNVLVVYDDGTLLLSTTETTAKYRNLQRDPRVTVHLLGDSFWQYLVVEGTASFTHLPEAHEPLRRYYRLASGEHANWDEYDRAMAAERRVLVTISVDRMYPLSG